MIGVIRVKRETIDYDRRLRARCCERQYRISGGMHGRAQRCRPPSPLEKAARKAAKHVLHEQRRLLMPPSRYHTSARKGSRDLKHYEEIKKSDDDGALGESVLHLEASDFGLPPDRHSVAPKTPLLQSLFLPPFFPSSPQKRLPREGARSRDCRAITVRVASALTRFIPFFRGERKLGTTVPRQIFLHKAAIEEEEDHCAERTDWFFCKQPANSRLQRLQRSSRILATPLALRSVASAVLPLLSSCLSSFFFFRLSVIRISRLRSCDRSSGHSSWRWKYYSRCFSLNSFVRLGFVLPRSDAPQPSDGFP